MSEGRALRVVVSLDDRTMDRIIDDLQYVAGYQRGVTSPLNLARWDLKHVLRHHGVDVRTVREDDS